MIGEGPNFYSLTDQETPAKETDDVSSPQVKGSANAQPFTGTGVPGSYGWYPQPPPYVMGPAGYGPPPLPDYASRLSPHYASYGTLHSMQPLPAYSYAPSPKPVAQSFVYGVPAPVSYAANGWYGQPQYAPYGAYTPVNYGAPASLPAPAPAPSPYGYYAYAPMSPLPSSTMTPQASFSSYPSRSGYVNHGFAHQYAARGTQPAFAQGAGWPRRHPH
ncbi:hypothetical protein THASP1DRAFT_33821 [Thamnocephalis sphaerospora]|uniref:Uncharacterized protein n=1 Tax=Thamnocephalis sphaerospora TaxID=78915 RepID=A0A4P9XFN4_9FUNG|nr:hypothetical protein THASP1DRAFT_33821 [Thamnocephalis sphaerospora]|eukprot:RKP04415.1 hypothetical protein THASP1DRAFT_33821 [Thamnocephalis sphaerospora]